MITMKSKGLETLRDSEGKGFLGCFAAIVILAAMLFLVIKLGPLYYTNYTFEEELKTVISRAGARYTTNDQITIDVLGLAQQHDINLTHDNAKDNIKIERFAGQLHLTVRYFVPVNFLILQRNLKFEIKISTFTAS